MGCLFSRWW